MANFITKSLKNKLVVLFLLVSILPLSIIGYVSYRNTRSALEKQVLSSLIAVVNSRISDITHLIQLRQEQAKELAGTFLVRQLESSGVNDPEDIAKIQIHIESILSEMKLQPESGYDDIDKVTAIETIEVLDINGKIVSTTNKKFIGLQVPDYTVKGVKSKGTFFGGFATDPHSGEDFLIIVQAIRDFEDKKFAGAILLEVKAQILNDIVKSQEGLGKTGEILIGQSVGDKVEFITSLRHTDDPPTVILGSDSALPVQEAAQGKSGSGISIDYRGKEIVAVWKHIPSMKWGIVGKIDTAEAFAPARNLGLTILSGSIIITLFIAFAAYFIARIIVKPIAELSVIAGKVAGGDFDVQADIRDTKDETGVLARAFNTMTSKLKESYANMEHKIDERTRELEKTNINMMTLQKNILAYNDTITLLNSSTEMDKLLSNCLSNMVCFTGSQVGIIYLYDEGEQCLNMASGYAVGDHNLKQEKIGLGIGIPGQAAQERKPILIKDIPDDTALSIKSGMDEYIPKNIGSFPLLFQGRLLGVLVLATLKEYTDDNLNFVNSVIVQLAVAISNVQSFELVQDQAERLKMQESELKEREERLRTILDNAVDAIITIDERGVIESFNYAAERIFGYTAAETIGNNVKMLQPEPYHSEHDGYLRNYLSTGKAKIIGTGREVTGLRKDGTTFPMELSVSEVIINEKRIFTGLVRDITRRKQAEEKLKSYNEKLQLQAEELQQQTEELRMQQKELEDKNVDVEKANRTKSEFLANMSHELRTPLNSIIGFSEVLEDKTFGELNKKQDKYVGNIRTSGTHLLQLINDILDLSKVEAGKMDMNYEEFSIPGALRDISTIIKTQVAKKNISLETEIGENLPSITADLKKFKQIMYNLFSNAVKFTPGGGKIIVKAERADEFARISVSDTGIGIKHEDQERVFTEFQQIDSKTSRTYAGTGLGLPLTRKFIEMHGGKIWVESELEKGSTFMFTIPLEAKSKPPADELSLLEDIDEIKGSSEGSLVLVVEDDPKSSELLTICLTQQGYQVANAFDGDEAVKKARELKPMAITLDINLPKKSGWEVLSELKEMPETSEIPIIIVSIHEDRKRGFHLGAIDYLTKPINKRNLLQTLERCSLTPKPGRKPIKVLVIDDEPKTVELVSIVLEAEGYQVQKAYGGREGIDLATTEEQDLIILDLMMPEVDGFTVVEELRKNPRAKDVPIIISTAKDLNEGDFEQLRGKVDAIAQKGQFSKEDLLEDIKKVAQMRGRLERRKKNIGEG